MQKSRKVFSLTALLFSALTLFATATPAQTAGPIRGLRVDPSYFYNLYPGQTAGAAATKLVAQAKASGANTLFVYAYNSVYGAFYTTTYSNTIVENGYGKQNILEAIATAAKLVSIRVVAVAPINNFKTLWTNNSAWRAKARNGADYRPFADTFLLSASHPSFKA